MKRLNKDFKVCTRPGTYEVLKAGTNMPSTHPFYKAADTRGLLKEVVALKKPVRKRKAKLETK